MGAVLFLGVLVAVGLALALGFALFGVLGGKGAFAGTSVSGVIGGIVGLGTDLAQFYGSCLLGGLGLVGYSLIFSIVVLSIALVINGLDDWMSGRHINPFGN